jgi:monofunctional biosynthetic peptidoglycan transglycosylase
MKYFWRWVARVVLVVVAVVVVYQFWLFGHVVWWVWFNPSESAFMEERLELLQEKNPKAELRHKWVPYKRISVHLKRALVAAEDAKFLDHDGFDWDAIQKAYEKNVRKGKVVAGGSTISQQLAKNLFLSGTRTPWRKAQEAIITVMIENTMSKQRIFEIYLNIIEWGNGVFGAEAAARHYYRTSASYLTAEQSARLAAMVPKPLFYDRVRYTPLLERRTAVILNRMSYSQVP